MRLEPAFRRHCLAGPGVLRSPRTALPAWRAAGDRLPAGQPDRLGRWHASWRSMTTVVEPAAPPAAPRPDEASPGAERAPASTAESSRELRRPEGGATRDSSRGTRSVPVWLEALLVVAIVGLGAWLRLTDLSTVPPGLHGDEAITGLEGRRILAEGWIGPYSPSALGQPTGPLYLTALSLRLLGDTTTALRVVPALLGTATVLALYLLLRRNAGVPTALMGAGALAVMSWHLHFSRIGFPLAAWPLVAVLAAGALLEASRTNRSGWWAAAGALTGLGVYVYNAHPLFAAVAVGFGLYRLFRWDVLAAVVATAVYALIPNPFSLLLLIVAVVHLLSSRRLGDRHRATCLLAFVGALGLVVLPMARFAADERNGYFQHAREYAIFGDPEWTALDSAVGRAGFLAGRYLGFWDRLCCHPRLDGVDATGITPIVPLPFLALAALGLVLGLRGSRESWVVLGGLVVAVVPLGAVLTVEGLARRTFAVAPFLAALAGFGLVALWRVVSQPGPATRIAAAVGVVLFAGWAAYRSLHDALVVFPRSPDAAWVFAREMADAARFMDGLPAGHHVYFLSDRWSVNYETRQFLAPDVSAEDRSAEFGRFGLDVDPGEGAPVFVLVGSYKDRLPRLETRYPGGKVKRGRSDADPAFIAFFPPAQDSSPPAVDLPARGDGDGDLTG